MKKPNLLSIIAADPELARAIAVAPATRGVAAYALPESAPLRRPSSGSLAAAATGAIRVVTESLRLPASTGPRTVGV